MDFHGYHRLSSAIIDFHRLSSTNIDFSSSIIEFHRLPSTSIDCYRLSSTVIDFHLLLLTFHRLSSTIMHCLTTALSLGGWDCPNGAYATGRPDQSLTYFCTIKFHIHCQFTSIFTNHIMAGFPATVHGDEGDCGYVPVFVFVKCSNYPFPSSLVPLFPNESSCKTFHTKMNFICVGRTHFNTNGFEHGPVLRQAKDNLEMAYWIKALWESIRAHY